MFLEGSQVGRSMENMHFEDELNQILRPHVVTSQSDPGWSWPGLE